MQVKDSAVEPRNPGKSLMMSCNDGVSCAHHGPQAVGKPSLSCGPLHPALPLGSRKRRAPCGSGWASRPATPAPSC
ncbi:sodium/potassium-transporting ATPase subunit gamma isoform X2 [Manis javanica]|uniref:sodium/potassium-transporting ATPase subunit gamma isoform X2 n=1 Tax=Manis javanica TaxID=9974 RepID=UPI003C6D2B3D